MEKYYWVFVVGTRVIQKYQVNHNKLSEEDHFMTTDVSVINIHCQWKMKLTQLIQLMMKNCTNSNLFITRASEQDLCYHNHSVRLCKRQKIHRMIQLPAGGDLINTALGDLFWLSAWLLLLNAKVCSFCGLLRFKGVSKIG